MTYKLLKDSNDTTITIENLDTKSSINMGNLTMERLNILEKAGYKIEEDGHKLTDKWDWFIEEETAKELISTTMKIKKPIRDQRKKEIKKQENKKIDAIDVLLGLANYN